MKKKARVTKTQTSKKLAPVMKKFLNEGAPKQPMTPAKKMQKKSPAQHNKTGTYEAC